MSGVKNPLDARIVLVDGPVAIFVHEAPQKEIEAAVFRLTRLASIAAQGIQKKSIVETGKLDFPGADDLVWVDVGVSAGVCLVKLQSGSGFRPAEPGERCDYISLQHTSQPANVYVKRPADATPR